MIVYIIIILVLALVGLLVDWKRVIKKLPKGMVKPRSKEKKARPIFAAKKPQEPTSSSEPFAIEPFAPNEEEQPKGYVPNKEVQDLLAEADIHFRKGELKAAEKFYLQAAAKDPRCSKAYSRLGVIYLESGDDWEDAEEAFRQALKTDPQNGFILNNLGLVLYHQDKYADAIRNFEQAVRQDDLNAARHANLGMAYMAMRQYAKAESAFKRALKLAPNELEYKDLLDEAVEKKIAHKAMVRK